MHVAVFVKFSVVLRRQLHRVPHIQSCVQDLAPRIYSDSQGNSVAHPVPGVVRNIMLEQVVEKWTDHIANGD